MKRHSYRRITVTSLMGLAVGFAAFPLAGSESNDAVAKRFRQYDADADQRITPRELPSVDAFKRLDTDADGEVTLAEARRAVKRGALKGIKLPPPPAAKASGPPATPSDSSQNPGASTPTAGDLASTAGDSDDLPPDDDRIRQGPRVLKPAEYRVGRLIPDVEFTGIDGRTHRLSDFDDAKATVIALTGIGCPLCQKYTPTLARLEDEFADRGVRFVFVNPNESEGIERLKETVKSFGLSGPYVRDTLDQITQALAARTTTEVFVLDAARTLIYRGAVDDQYGFGYSLEQPRNHYAVDALEAVLSGRRPEIAATTSPGCDLYYEHPSQPNSIELTYHNRISRIIQNNCLECHRDGGQAPFSLADYESVVDYAGMIKNVVRRQVMPPWFAAASEPAGEPSDDQVQLSGGVSHSPTPIRWANDRSLADEDQRDLLAWIESGVIEGEEDDAPLPRTFPKQWMIGEPDLVVQLPRPIDVKATGRMPYQHASVEIKLEQDQWIQAVEIQPTAPAVVHHVLVFVKMGEKRIDEEAGFFAAYVPGNTYQQYPVGIAKKLPAGASLVFQMHYTPNGRATQDQTRLGIVFSDQPPRRMIRNVGIANHKIEIPPREDNHPETASLRVPADVQLISLLPHMHLRGKAIRYDLTYPDGRQQRLLDIPRYDFNWQLEYRLAEPLSVPGGTLIEVKGWFDNSDANPANPDPDATVRWGPQTEDEMLLGYIEYLAADPSPNDPPSTP